jgi:hypothetical protein
VRVKASVELDGVADGLEHLAHVGGDVDEHERVELRREVRRGHGVGEVRLDVADGVRAGDGGAEEGDGLGLAGVGAGGVGVGGVCGVGGL